MTLYTCMQVQRPFCKPSIYYFMYNEFQFYYNSMYIPVVYVRWSTSLLDLAYIEGSVSAPVLWVPGLHRKIQEPLAVAKSFTDQPEQLLLVLFVLPTVAV